MEQQLTNLVTTLEKQEDVKKDYLINSTNLTFVDGKLVVLKQDKKITYEPSKTFHSQISEVLKIPKTYYDRMYSNPEARKKLFDNDVTFWLNQEGKNHLIRTFEDVEDKKAKNTARAFLSDSYNVIDNYEVLLEALDAIKRTGKKVTIESAELSETRMYLSVVSLDVQVKAKEMLRDYSRAREIKVGDLVYAGFKLLNSEIGKGMFKVMPRAKILACGNGLVVERDALKRVHLGADLSELGMFDNKKVRDANRKLIREQVTHAISMFLSENYLKGLVDRFTTMGNKQIEAPIPGVIEVVAKEYDISNDRKNSILNYFTKGGDTRRIGLVNAITEELQTLKDADLKHDSELIPYDMLTKFDRLEKDAFKVKFTNN